MLLHKTELARATLARTGTELGRRERQVLILCDGRRSLDAIVAMLGVGSLGMIQPLIASGYLAHDAITAASLAVALQTAHDDDERALALVDALAWLRTATKSSVCGRVAERLKEIVPEAYLAGIEAAWQQMIVNDLSAADASSNVLRFEARA